MKISAGITFVCTALAGSIVAAAAATPNYPTKAYDALYERTSSIGKSDYRMMSDGKGHMRIESQAPGLSSKSIVIYDFPKQQIFILLEQQKLVMKQPLNNTQSVAPPDEQKIKSMGGTSLGAKVIDGHPCHGWKYESNGVISEAWNADDIPCTIQALTTTAQGKEEQHLKKYTAGAPGPNEFVVPSGYKMQNMSAMTH